MPAQLLRQKTTGHLFVWTANLAQRDDMEPYVRPEPEPAAQENTSENPDNASAAPSDHLSEAKAAFRRQVGRGPGRPKKTSGSP